jgi:NAD(P)-dependent dehydrogenase (short-subunit alcohol dehydrogenase family)
MSRVLASHLGGKGVTSNVVACGPFASKMMAATLEKHRESVEAGIPMGRIGSAEDVAGTCIWLSGRAGSWVNGATIALDGGSVVSAKL